VLQATRAPGLMILHIFTATEGHDLRRRMSPKAPKPRSLGQEMASADLGDRRLSQRLKQLVTAVARAPADSFPELASSDAELEGMYRFMSNEAVGWKKVLEPHLAATVERAQSSARTLLVIQDSSDFYFSGEALREGLGHMPQGQGFIGHFALAVACDGTERSPLGLLGVETIFRRGPATPKPKHERESARWPRMVDEIQTRVGKLRPIHVMDREADDYSLLAKLTAEAGRFIIRINEGRVLEHEGRPPSSETPHLNEALQVLEGTVLRTVVLSRRVAKNKKNARSHASRDRREANLSVRALQVRVQKPYNVKHETKALTLNVVQVFEPSPPEDAEPICWTLATSEPISTLAEVTAVVDWYCARWLVEEFFKALKTGCAFEKRQLETAHSLLNALAVLAPVAWRLLVLRSLSRERPETPASTVFSEDELKLLRVMSKRVKLSNEPSVDEALRAIAGLGGHLKNNGPPGWMVIGRGYDKFLAYFAGWTAAREM